MHFLYQTVNDAFLEAKINGAEHRVYLTAPGVSMSVAKALANAVKRLDGNVHLLIDASLESFTRGYNEPQAVLLLQDCIKTHGLDSFRCEDGIRIGVLSVDEDEPVFFLPESVMLESLNEDSYNSAFYDEKQHGDPIGKTNLCSISVPSKEQIEELKYPKTKEEQLQVENIELKQKVKKLQEEIMNMEKEKGRLPIQENLKFVDIEVSNYRFNTLKIKVPGKFLSDRNDVSARMDSKYLVLDTDESMDEMIEIDYNGTRRCYRLLNFFKEIDNLRDNFTVSLGKWKRAILASKRDAFEEECNRLCALSCSIRKALEKSLELKIDSRLEELFQALKPLIETQYKAEHPMIPACSKENLFCYFKNEMSLEINKTLSFFDPQIRYVYKELSREDAESESFRKTLNKTFHHSAFLCKEVIKERTFLHYDEEILRVSQKGKWSVVIIVNYNNYPRNRWELLRGIQRFWKRIVEFIPKEKQHDLEFELKLLFSLEKDANIRIDNLSYLDILDQDVVNAGTFGQTASVYLKSIPSSRWLWEILPLFGPDYSDNRNPQKWAKRLYDEFIQDLDSFGRNYNVSLVSASAVQRFCDDSTLQ